MAQKFWSLVWWLKVVIHKIDSLDASFYKWIAGFLVALVVGMGGYWATANDNFHAKWANRTTQVEARVTSIESTLIQMQSQLNRIELYQQQILLNWQKEKQ